MREGFKSILEFLEADLEIEQEQEHLYNQLATVSKDAKVKETFNIWQWRPKGIRMCWEGLSGILKLIITM